MELKDHARSWNFDVAVSVVAGPVWLAALFRVQSPDSVWRPTTPTNLAPPGDKPRCNTEPTDGSVERTLHILSANSVARAARDLAK
jgi:hypothetical protein